MPVPATLILCASVSRISVTVVYMGSLVSVMLVVGLMLRAFFTSASISSDGTLSVSQGSRAFGWVTWV